jgi:transcriptional adapter 2-alpha
MDQHFDIDPSEFQERKRRRISSMNTATTTAKVAPTSAPGVHEVATFLPGRLEFEHELDNEAEDLVKDLEFGICLFYGGDEIPEDEEEVKEKVNREAERKSGVEIKPTPIVNGVVPAVNGVHLMNGDVTKPPDDKAEDKDGDDDVEEITQPPPIETEDSVAFKLTVLDMYWDRIEKRSEAKAIMFERGLLEYKKVCAVILA